MIMQIRAGRREHGLRVHDDPNATTRTRGGTLMLPMSPSSLRRARVSVEEYLAAEATASEKHILWDGEVFPATDMSGGSFDHNTICANTIIALGNALRGTRCRVVTSDQKVWVPRKAGFVYPDVTALCGRAEPYPGAPDVLTNPLLIIEVLSEGTERFDRGEKFEGYRSIPSLRHYLMLSSRHPLVEHYARDNDDAWLLRTYGASETVNLHTPDLALLVEDLYRLAFSDEA